jgi:hypothetical protein
MKATFWYVRFWNPDTIFINADFVNSVCTSTDEAGSYIITSTGVLYRNYLWTHDRSQTVALRKTSERVGLRGPMRGWYPGTGILCGVLCGVGPAATAWWRRRRTSVNTVYRRYHAFYSTWATYLGWDTPCLRYWSFIVVVSLSDMQICIHCRHFPLHFSKSDDHEKSSFQTELFSF